VKHFAVGTLASAALLASCASAGSRTDASAIKVGPPSGAAMVVGGGALGPEIYQRFIELAGGPDALIIDVPTSGGAQTYGQDAPGARAFRAAGARNVIVLHTYDRKLADTDSFVAPIRRAGGVWFDGGRHYRLVDSYGGTRSEAAFHDVLARGGVVGGSSAGASIQGSFLVRGAPSNNNNIMAYPGYEKGFGFLRGVGIDQHVVARERLPDLADSILPRYPNLLLISEDEGTAWVVRGDTGEIIGRSKAFVYGGKDATDEGKPFLTLWPGDKYNLATRRVMHRAIDETRLTRGFVDSLFRVHAGNTPATVLIAHSGKILVNASYHVPPQRRYMPTTTLPLFAIGGISDILNATLGAEADGSTAYGTLVQRRISGPAGMVKTRVDTTQRTFSSSVDELYRWSRILPADQAVTAYATREGGRGAFVRQGDVTIIILTDSDSTNVRAIADAIAQKLASPSR
jgi:cyanophycinase